MRRSRLMIVSMVAAGLVAAPVLAQDTRRLVAPPVRIQVELPDLSAIMQRVERAPSQVEVPVAPPSGARLLGHFAGEADDGGSAIHAIRLVVDGQPGTTASYYRARLDGWQRVERDGQIVLVKERAQVEAAFACKVEAVVIRAPNAEELAAVPEAGATVTHCYRPPG